MTGWWDDVVYAARSLARRPGFTGFAVVTVALGVGASTAIYSTLDAVLLNPVPYEGAERMVTLHRPGAGSGILFYPTREQIEVWGEMDDLFEAVAVMSGTSTTLTGEGDPRELLVGNIRPSFLEFTERTPLLGRSFTAEEVERDARVVLLDHGLWRSTFGSDPDILGRTLELNGEAWEVIGVMPPDTPLLSFGVRTVDAWRPLPPDASTSSATALLREGVSIEAVNERLGVPIELESGEVVVGAARSLVETVGLRMGDTVRMLMVSVSLLLLIACFNVSNLLLGRANRRRRETAVRTALGGGRVRIARQMLVEGLLLGGGGGLLGLVVAFLGLEAILSLRPAGLDQLQRVRLDGPVLLFAIGSSLGASLLFSIAPVWHGTREEALDSLRNAARTVGDGVLGRRVRWVLVSGEVALSFALVVGSVLVLDALGRLRSQDPGFRADEVVAVRVALPSWRYPSSAEALQDAQAIRARLRSLPGVAHATRSLGAPPAAGVASGRVEVEGRPMTEESHVFYGPVVDRDYFETLGLPLLRGRTFTAAEIEAEQDVVVLGEGAARHFFGSIEIEGRRIRIGEGDEWTTVVGVAADVPMTGLSAVERGFQIYWPIRPRYGSGGMYLVRAGTGLDVQALTGSVRTAIREVVPEARISGLGTLEAQLADTLDRERFGTALMSLFALLALTLAGVGLYGVISQVVGQRRHEIGVRMTLGARPPDIGALVLRQGVVATVAGILAGLVVARLGFDLLSTRLVGLDESSLSVYAFSAVAVGALALLSTWAPARRAARVDPVRAMRAE